MPATPARRQSYVPPQHGAWAFVAVPLALGWTVIRVWEHEDMKRAALHIAAIVRTGTAQHLDPDSDTLLLE